MQLASSLYYFALPRRIDLIPAKSGDFLLSCTSESSDPVRNPVGSLAVILEGEARKLPHPPVERLE